MFFKRIYDEGLAQASYLLGCPEQGVALIVDPRRDTQVYIELAEQHNLRIVAVTETHIHADYLSGARELAALTGAALYLSDEGGTEWQYSFPHHGLHHGDELSFGTLNIRVLHTPGHTPEHVSFLVTDSVRLSRPVLLLSGDFVLVGDIGRPNLRDEGFGGKGTRFDAARQLLDSLQQSFLTLPDYVQIWPGHGAGSACGNALGGTGSSTVGYELSSAWWASFLLEQAPERFTAEILSNQPDIPAYFARMKRQNREGPGFTPRAPLPKLAPQELADKILIDTRPAAAYQASILPDAINISAGPHFETWAGWLIDPEFEMRPLVLLAADAAEAQVLRERLWRVGIDNIAGYVTDISTSATQTAVPIEPSELGAYPDAFILDVRTRAEHAGGHLPGATLIHAGRLPQRLFDLPKDTPIIVYCQSGARSPGAASLLRAHGFRYIQELAGGYTNWLRSSEAAQTVA